MIRVLVADRFAEQIQKMKQILESDAGLKVIATAQNGKETIEKTIQLKPDIIVMDLYIKEVTAIEATHSIMELSPTPIIIMQSLAMNNKTIDLFEAMEAGALDLINKEEALTLKKNEFLQTIKLMSEVKVVHRYRHLKKEFKKPSEKESKEKTLSAKSQNIKLIAIGSSTGGPIAIQDIFKKLVVPFPPIVVVQHISPTFLPGLVEWLHNTTSVNIKIASQYEFCENNWIYFAPDGYQMGINTSMQISLSHRDPENGHIPSVSYLFRAIAKTDAKNTLNILLTGMGSDGAKELKLLKDKGAITIAQDKESAVIFGMPGEAILLNAAQHVLNPSQIADFINNIYHDKK